jgi:hypothetical protein
LRRCVKSPRSSPRRPSRTLSTTWWMSSRAWTARRSSWATRSAAPSPSS